MLIDNIKIAFSSLSHRRLRSWLTMIGIFIGIAAVVSLIGLGEGLNHAISSQFGFLGTDVLTIQAAGIAFAGPPGTGVTTPLSDTLVDKIRKVNGVDSAINRNIRSANLVFNDKRQIAYVASMPSGKDRKTVETSNNLKTIDGRLLRDGDTKSVVLGNDYYTTDAFGKQVHAGSIVTIQGAKFIVVGILEKKGTFQIDRSILINDKDFNDLYGNHHSADLIIVRVKDVNLINAVQSDLEKLLRKERDVKKGEENFTVQSPQKTLETLNSTLFAIKLFVYIIAAISIVVGGIGIMNTMYTAVLERTREIGIMKAIGARNSTIFLLFSFESGFLGMVGGIIGVLLGLGLAYGLAFIGRIALGADLIQASISPLLMVSALAGSFILGTFFGVLPAVRASKMQPVEALRK